MNAFIEVHGQAAFWLLAVTTLLSELGMPVPVIATALFVGAHALRGAGDVAMLTGAMVSASVIGDIVWFAAGRRYGTNVLKLLCRFSLAPGDYASRTRQRFESWGSLALVAGRFVPGALLLAAPLAGAMGMGAGKFVALTTVGAALYAMALLGAGFLMRDQIGMVLVAAQGFGWALLIAALMLALCIVWLWCRHVARSAETRNPPHISDGT